VPGLLPVEAGGELSGLMPVSRRMTREAVLENPAMSGAGESGHSISRKNGKGKEDEDSAVTERGYGSR